MQSWFMFDKKIGCCYILNENNFLQFTMGSHFESEISYCDDTHDFFDYYYWYNIRNKDIKKICSQFGEVRDPPNYN